MRQPSSLGIVLASALALCATAAAQGPGRRAGTAVAPGQACPPGTTETRPGNCQAPETPAPSIVDYRPRSTLVTPQHPVPRAKFPTIDVHGHPGNLTSADAIDRVVREMDALNLRMMVVAENVTGDRLTRTLQALAASSHKERFRVMAGVDFRNVGPGWAERVVAQLDADLKAGAVGVGEIPKSFGLTITKPDGSRLRVDDPALDPLWQAFARHDVPVFIHTGEPQEFFQPLDLRNERWLELSLFPDRRNSQPGHVTFDALMDERDALFRRHPKTRFIVAHFGWHANDLAKAAAMLDAFPNITIEAGAVLYDLGRQPRMARDFFTRYQDRIMFGKDAFQPSEYPYYWRVFETNDEYFDYYRGYHAFWKLYGMGLGDEVLKKVYYRNALRTIKGLPQAGWPN